MNQLEQSKIRKRIKSIITFESVGYEYRFFCHYFSKQGTQHERLLAGLASVTYFGRHPECNEALISGYKAYTLTAWRDLRSLI